MGAGRRTQTIKLNENSSSPLSMATGGTNNRNLRKNDLGGVIFGCKNNTINECRFKQLFGLPSQHFSYVKNIDPGLPLFLFNYSDRKLHGIFEAASPGEMNIDPYGWTMDGSERTLYPAQVQVRMRLQCYPLPEERFKPIIKDNYYTQSHFWFELDHAQTSKLLSFLSSQVVAANAPYPQNTVLSRPLHRIVPAHGRRENDGFNPPSHGRRENDGFNPPPHGRRENDGFNPPPSDVNFPHSLNSSGLGSTDIANSLHTNQEHTSNKQVPETVEKDLIYTKLKELAVNREGPSLPLASVGDNAVRNDMINGGDVVPYTQMNAEESILNSFGYPSVIAQLIQEMEQLRDFKLEHTHKMGCLEKKLVEAETEIQQLKQRCSTLESVLHPSVGHVDEMTVGSVGDLELDLDELIFFVGGYDGMSWLSAFDSYSPEQDVLRHLKPMTSVRAYASVAKLHGDLYVFGGGDGNLWHDTVESYNLTDNEWTPRPSLNMAKGSLGGATLNDKIFVMGGGNGLECFADVEMFDINIGRWITTRSMLQKRFALAATELNGALYAIGGYDGKDYLKTAERFDPREHCWTRIESMNTSRGCHSVVVLNEKLYAIGGYDGSGMGPSVEVYDPRVGVWTFAEPMDKSRGYAAATVCKESIYITGGVMQGETIVDTVECYKEGRGWEVIKPRNIGKRCFFSAITL